MLLIKKKKLHLKILDVYYGRSDMDLDDNVDIIYFAQAEDKFENSRSFNTLHINLTNSEEYLFKEFNKNSRRDINKAKKDKFNFYMETMPSTELIYNFSGFYRKFAKTKKFRKQNFLKDMKRKKGLCRLRDNKALVISYVTNAENTILVYHVHINDGNRARLLYSASHFRNYNDKEFRSLVARVNRYLHWMDMKAFKNKLLEIYDFGGLALNEANAELKNIDRFKLGFGGQKVVEYYSLKALSLKGKIVVSIMSLLGLT